MAELILTQAEKDANTWLELDDTSLGKVVKHAMLHLVKVSNEQEKIVYVSAAMMLIGQIAVDGHIGTFNYEVEGLTRAGKKLGNWKLTIKEIAKKSSPTLIKGGNNG